MHTCLSTALVAASVAVGAPVVAAQHIDTVRVGSPALSGAGPQPGTYTLESVSRADGHDTPMGTTAQSVSRDRRGNQDVYVIRTVHVAAPRDTTIAVIVVRAADLALVHHRVQAERDSAAAAAGAGYVTGWVALPGEPVRLIDRRLGSVFPVEGQIPWLFPLLPLADGYRAAVPHYSEWEDQEVWTTIRVVASEPVVLGGSAVDCWKVDGGELFPGYTVTYWVDKPTRRVVQGVARGGGPGPEYWSRLRTP